MISKKFFFPILFLTVLSCRNDEGYMLNNQDILKYKTSDFKEYNLISKIIDSVSNYLIAPGPLYVADNYLVALESKSQMVMHVVNLDNEKYIGSYGKKGQGPGEITSPWSLSKINERSFILMDVSQRKILTYNIDSLLNKNTSLIERKTKQNSTVSFVEIYKDKLFFIDEFNFGHRIYSQELDDSESKINGYGSIPLLIKSSEADNVKAAAASAIMRANHGVFVFAYKMTPRIDIFDYEKDTWKTIISPKNFELKYKSDSQEGEQFFAVTKETLNAYIDIALTDNYIYALFSEDTLLESVYSKGKIIYVFDYEGKPIRKYNLDKEISFLTIKNDSIMYAIRVDVFPELLKFNLNK